jgi:hypothetical protein
LSIFTPGRVMVHKYAGKDEEKNEIWLPIATPLGVPARLRAVDQEGAYGLRVTVRGMDRQPRAVEFDRARLARMGASEIRAHLFAAGRTQGLCAGACGQCAPRRLLQGGHHRGLAHRR